MASHTTPMNVGQVSFGLDAPTTLKCAPSGGKLTLVETPFVQRDLVKCVEGKTTDMGSAARV